MPFQLQVPRSQDVPLDISLNIGESLYVLGANGTGKSSLMYRFYAAYPQLARRITAHRQTWFESSSVSISASERKNTQQNIGAWDAQEKARWTDTAAGTRPIIAIFDLVDAENVRARSIAAAVDEKDIPLAEKLSTKDAPIKVINDLLRLSNLPIQISIQSSQEVVASKFGGAPYGIAQLSDGERNVLLIATDVLTATAGTLFLVDEPERHLHRSIISPLLTELFKKRSDCSFVVSTHDASLPLDNPKAQTLLVRRCAYTGNSITGWDADLVTPEYSIDDSLKRDLLGSRRKILFVEGMAHSLDLPLYSLVFPEVSVLPKESCRDVEYAVGGLRGASDLHWVHAFGIIDNDGRSPEDIEQLKGKGVYALPVLSVESLYYDPEIQRRVAERQANVTGYDVPTTLAKAHAEAMAAISSHAQRLSERIAEKAAREDVLGRLPKRADMKNAQPINIAVDIPGILAGEQTKIQTALVANDLTKLLQRYPVRETPALDKIAKALGFQGREQYEAAVQKLLLDSPEAVAFIKSQFGSLAKDIA